MKAPGRYFNFIMINDLYQALNAKLWQTPQDVNFESISKNFNIISTYEYQGEIITERQICPCSYHTAI